MPFRNTAAWLTALILCTSCVTPIQQTLTTEVATEFLFYKHAKGPKGKKQLAGGLGNLYVEVTPNPKRRAPVRYAETVSGGVGDTWRATIWMALMAASSALDIDPLSIRVTIETDGTVDGPSAGALMTAAIMAAALKKPVKKTATLTGTINPDLTIGPVGAIGTKVVAALKAGKTRIGVPYGQAETRMGRSRAKVNLRSIARRYGAKIFEISDVQDAYHVLTGDQLDRSDALTPAQMRLPVWASGVFGSYAVNVVREATHTLNKSRKLVATLNNSKFTRIFAELELAGQRVIDMVRNNDTVNAVYLASQLKASCFEATTMLLTDVGMHLGRWDYVRKLLRSHRLTVAGLLQSGVPAWQKYTPHDAVEVPYTVDTFESFIHAIREFSEANAALKKSPVLTKLLNDDAYNPKAGVEKARVRDALLNFTHLMVDAQTNLVLSKAYLAVGEAWLALGKRDRTSALPANMVAKIAEHYQKVADANLQYVDTLLVKDYAEKHGRPVTQVREILMGRDDDYRQAIMNRRLPTFLDNSLFSVTQRQYANMSGAVSSYFASATVISKHYSLGARFDKRKKRVVGVRRESTLNTMLVNADKQARQVAAQCQTMLGEIPIITLIEYDLGRRLHQEALSMSRSTPKAHARSIRWRISALGHLWRATTMGRLAIAASRRIEAFNDARR